MSKNFERKKKEKKKRDTKKEKDGFSTLACWGHTLKKETFFFSPCTHFVSYTEREKTIIDRETY